MIIGVPKEIKDNESRVAITPNGVHALVSQGHTVLIQKGAGINSSFSDEAYAAQGAKIVGLDDVFNDAEMIIKVKEPQKSEYTRLKENQILFTYLHLAADEKQTHGLIASNAACIAYETVELNNGSLPLLTPMSEVAGRISIQAAAHYLEKPNGGSGRLLGGVPGVQRSTVTVVGGGTVGINAALMALGMGANVIIIDNNLNRLRYLDEVLHGNFQTMASNSGSIAESMEKSDVVIGGVLIPGARAPHLVTREMISRMKPGSVVVDVAVDQGGCIETTHPTTHSDPVYVVDGVVHYAVTNMPGAVPNTSTWALTNATLPYVIKLANLGFAQAVQSDMALAKGVNVYQGNVTYPAVADAFGLKSVDLFELM